MLPFPWSHCWMSREEQGKCISPEPPVSFYFHPSNFPAQIFPCIYHSFVDFFAINWVNFLSCPEWTPGFYCILWEWGPATSQTNRDEHPQFATHSLVSDIPTIHSRDRLFVIGFHLPQRHQRWSPTNTPGHSRHQECSFAAIQSWQWC